MVIDKVSEDKLVLKSDGKLIEAKKSECDLQIPIQVLLATRSCQLIYLLDVLGNENIEDIESRIATSQIGKINKADWYLKGKTIEKTARIGNLNLIKNEKLMCSVLGYDIKKYKRFPRLDESRGWYLSTSSSDAITYVNQKDIFLFGFGMYVTREGTPTYRITYKIYFDEDIAVTNSLDVTKGGSSDVIKEIYFTVDQTPKFVKAGTKIGVSVKYDHYEEDSRLIVGKDGNDHDKIEGNDPGLFKIESHKDSGNGTGTDCGQIPEVYYSIST